ncbi:LacI family DNA-binding transcriptional regulator [Amphibiibacter pelophylacis]|uniref:LacI family DNA-binding transcriptional regulator n=1 Tax=Amphibiibacter pelophylacis TaxID=1799477 RepID=A0ACC6P082_9BURK
MPLEKATLHTLVQTTGLSLATVSRALSGSSRVLPATRERVLRAAQELGYVRDRAALHLKTGRTQVLAFIMDRPDASQPGFQALLLGLGESVQGSDYQLIVLPDDPQDPLASVRYVVERGMADGLVLAHTTPQDARVNWLQQRGFPFVTHGRTQPLATHGHVDFDNGRFAARAVEALASRQRRRLGLLLPMPGSAFRGHLDQGFRATCERPVLAGRGLTGQVIEAISLDDSPEALYQWARAHAADFDGLVVSREAPVLPLLGALADARLQVGRDIDLALKYSSPLPRYLRQPLLTCFEDLHLAGLTLGRSLIAHLIQPDQAVAQVLFEPPAIQFPPTLLNPH